MDNLTQTTPGSAADSPDLTGQTLGDYQVLRKLGQGGMGQVYLAEQLSLKRKVALKLLKPELAANEIALKRFKAEAEAVAKATHANIVQVYQIGELNGHHFMALEYVEGRNLRDFIARKGPPEPPLAISILRQCAAALQRASELGLIHRDIKPDNILLTKKGEVKVADFGLSRVREGDQPAVNLTQSGVTMGTPLYMSPEQVEGKQLDPRTDIYSLGVTAYHMLAGEPPFKGSTAFEVALQHVRAEPPELGSIRTDLPPELCAIIHKMMAKAPADRYQSGKELIKDLVRARELIAGQTGFVLATTGPVEARATSLLRSMTPASTSTVLPRKPSKRRWVLALFLFSLLAAGAAGGAMGYLRQRDKGPGDEDERSGIEPAPVNTEITPLQKRDQQRKALIEEHLDPANNYKNPKLGVELCLDYVLPLLENPDRYDEAEELFRRLEAIDRIEQYHYLGLLGKGIVFALRDKWELSNEAFRAIQTGKKRPAEFGPFWELMRGHPPLRKWLAEAVDHNQKTSGGKVQTPQFVSTALNRGPRPGGGGPARDRKPFDRGPKND